LQVLKIHSIFSRGEMPSSGLLSREYQEREKVSKLWDPRSSIRLSSFCCSRAQ
jgi:hypothetical protein